MSELFFRTLSQGLQAFIPVAAALSWARCTGRIKPIAAMRWGLAAGVLLTPAAGYLFAQSTLQARWEALLAAFTASLTLFFIARPLRRSRAGESASAQPGAALLVALAAATIVIVTRQTMEVAVVFKAVLDMRSRDAFIAVTGAVAASIALAIAYVQANRRVSAPVCQRATAAFAGVFFLQALVYAFHESAEAGFLPFSEMLHAASEPYGPDGAYGQWVSYLLLAVPIVAAATTRTQPRAAIERAPWHERVLAWPVQAAGAVALLLVAGVIVLRAQNTTGRGLGIGSSHAASAVTTASAGIHLPPAMAGSRLLYRHTAGDAASSSLAFAALETPAAALLSVPFACDRVSYAAGRGICLQTERGMFTTYKAVLFDETMQPRHSIKLEGSPSRTRISADGRLGAVTVFVTGQAHGYSSSSFSTRTSLIDMATGEELTDLEQFTTWRDGVKIHAADFNFWGVTFAKNSNTFYATLKTDGKTYLVKGDLGLRKLTVLHENLECPSLSPNNRLIAFKKRTGPDLAPWRIYVLDLETMTEHAIEGETRSVDDQLEWLDDEHVLYGMRRSSQSALSDVWVAAVDGKTPARVFAPEADSPIVVRATQ
jgi:hypothetical protein